MTPSDRQLLEARENDHRARATRYRNDGDDNLARALDAEADHLRALCENL